MKPVVKKILMWAGVIFGIFVLWVLVFGVLWEPMQRRIEQYREKKLVSQYEKQQREIEEAYKNDTYGGKTPEETFDMFLDALKKGDIELASKYYELSVQPKALEGLKEELQKEGNLEKSVRYFTDVRKKGEKRCRDIEMKSGGCTFRYTYTYSEEAKVPITGTNDFLAIPAGGTLDQITDFELSHYTQIWKITQPY